MRAAELSGEEGIAIQLSQQPVLRGEGDTVFIRRRTVTFLVFNSTGNIRLSASPEKNLTAGLL